VISEEAQHARYALELGNVDVEIEPVEALDLERHVISEDGRRGAELRSFPRLA